MNRRAVVSLSLVSFLSFAVAGCVLTHHETQPAALGQTRRAAELLAVIDQPGPLTVETVASADWKIDRSGLIDLQDPKAKEAGLKDGLEPIEVYFHVIRHPTRGTFIVDTGMEKRLRDDPQNAAIRGLVAHFMHLDLLKINVALGDWVAAQKEPLRGVFLTHLHLDHISGMADVPHGTPIYAGPHEASEHSFANGLLQSDNDRAFAGQAALSEWRFEPDADGRFAGLLDVFGDGSLWAIWVPGHTAGSTAYLARTANGPVLLTGDTCHTVFGWERGVAPGSFTADHRANEASLAKLRQLAAEHPAMQVRLGHQSLATSPPASTVVTIAGAGAAAGANNAGAGANGAGANGSPAPSAARDAAGAVKSAAAPTASASPVRGKD